MYLIHLIYLRAAFKAARFVEYNRVCAAGRQYSCKDPSLALRMTEERSSDFVDFNRAPTVISTERSEWRNLVCCARHRRRNMRSPTTTAQALRRARP